MRGRAARLMAMPQGERRGVREGEVDSRVMRCRHRKDARWWRALAGLCTSGSEGMRRAPSRAPCVRARGVCEGAGSGGAWGHEGQASQGRATVARFGGPVHGRK